jgi:hypothetical protein
VGFLWVTAYRMGLKPKKKDDEERVASVETEVSCGEFDTKDTPVPPEILEGSISMAPACSKRVRFMTLSPSQTKISKPLIDFPKVLEPLPDDETVNCELDSTARAEMNRDSVVKIDVDDCDESTKRCARTLSSSNAAGYLHLRLKQRQDGSELESPWWQDNERKPGCKTPVDD